MATIKTKTARVNVRLLDRATKLVRTVRPDATQAEVLEWALESLCAKIYMDERNAARQYELWHAAQSEASRLLDTLETVVDVITTDLDLPPVNLRALRRSRKAGSEEDGAT